jgi:hypothetical protein
VVADDYSSDSPDRLKERERGGVETATVHEQGASPTSPTERTTRVLLRVFTVARFAMRALLIIGTVLALLTRAWVLALVGVVAIGWRLGVRGLIEQQRKEVERWQGRGDSSNERQQ